MTARPEQHAADLAAHDRAFERFRRRGEPSDLAAVYDATADRLLRAALHLAPSAVAAEDLVQATFLVAIEKAGEFIPGRPVQPWLLGILANQARLARWRDGRNPDATRLADRPAPAPFDAARREELDRALDDAIETLPASYRPVLVLHLRHELKAAEIALALGRPAGTVRSQLSRGIAMVRQALPTSLAGLLATTVLAPAGLAQVRATVLAKVPVSAGLGGALAGTVAGGILMKQLILAAAVLAIAAFTWAWWPTAEAVEPDATGGAEPPTAQTPAAESPATTSGDREVVAGETGPAPTPSTGNDPATTQAPGTGSLEILTTWGSTGEPAADVTVTLAKIAGQWESWRVARTGADGVARFVGVPRGTRFVRALRGGHQNVTVVPDQTTRVTLQIPGGVAVDLRVIDAAGTPVPDAAVWLSERWRANRGIVVDRTDGAGRARLQDVSPDCSLAVRCRGYRPSPAFPVKGSIGGTIQLRITLQRGGGRVRGTVLAPSGKPIAGAQVLLGVESPGHAHRAGDGTWIPGPPPALRRTDATGRFTVAGLAPGNLPVQVRHPDYAPFRGTVELLADSTAHPRFTLAPAARLTGVVEDEAGEPVAYATVRVGERYTFGEVAAYSTRDGRFELRGLRPGEVEATATQNKRTAKATLHLQADAANEWRAVLQPNADNIRGSRLTGRVVDHLGKPLRAWRVAAQQAADARKTNSISTDADGRFALSVPWEVARVWVHPPRAWGQMPPWIRNDVRPADGELTIRVEAPELRSGTVKGTVVDGLGRPVQATIEVWQETFKLWRQFATDAKTGAFEIENLPPGKVHLKVCPREHPWIKLPPKTIEAGVALDLGRLVAKPAGYLEGHARFRDGAPAAKLTLQVLQPKGGEAAVVKYANGQFRSGPLEPGTYNLHVTGPRVASTDQRIQIRASQPTTVDITLTKAALRVLRLQLPAGVPMPRFLNVHIRGTDHRLAWYGGSSGKGAPEVRASAPVGDYRLTVYGPGASIYLETSFRIDSLADAEPITLQLHAPKRK